MNDKYSFEIRKYYVYLITVRYLSIIYFVLLRDHFVTWVESLYGSPAYICLGKLRDRYVRLTWYKPQIPIKIP